LGENVKTFFTVKFALLPFAAFWALLGARHPDWAIWRGRLKGSKSPIRNLVIAGGGNVGAGVAAVVISGANAAEALVPGLLSKAGQSPAPQRSSIESAPKPQLAENAVF